MRSRRETKTLMMGVFMPFLGLETAKVSCLVLATKLAKYGTSKLKNLPPPLVWEIMLKTNKLAAYGAAIFFYQVGFTYYSKYFAIMIDIWYSLLWIYLSDLFGWKNTSPKPRILLEIVLDFTQILLSYFLSRLYSLSIC